MYIKHIYAKIFIYEMTVNEYTNNTAHLINVCASLVLMIISLSDPPPTAFPEAPTVPVSAQCVGLGVIWADLLVQQIEN